MPYARPRHVLPRVLERLKSSRVISLQGPRQSGKSFLARDILPTHLRKSRYITLDEARLRSSAQKDPDLFLARFEGNSPLIIDEAQKAPDLFDAVKLVVDQDNTPGQFILLGSTEFSTEVQVKESLTGRLSRVRVYPFTLREACDLPPVNPNRIGLKPVESGVLSRANLLRHLDRGGFPGIFSVREAERRHELLEDWVKLTCERDLFQFPEESPDPVLARDLLEGVARLVDPGLSEFHRKFRVSPRTISKHLKLLAQLFAIVPLVPCAFGTGKIRHFLCDVGLAAYLGASLQRQLVTWVLHEYLVRWECAKGPKPKFQYFRGTRGGIVDLVLETSPTEITGIKVIDTERFDSRDLVILHSFQDKAKAAGYSKIRLIAIAPISAPEIEDGVEIIPWEYI